MMPNAGGRDQAFASGGALVVGGSGAIGGSICEALAAAGSDVSLTYRTNREGAEAVAARVRKFGRRAHVARMDIEDPAHVRNVVADVIAHHGSVHSIVYASGPQLRLEFIQQVEPGHWKQVFDSDVNGCFNLISASLPHLRKNGRGSYIAITTCAVARVPKRDILSAAPKAAIETLMRGVAKEEGRYGIRANCVAPGWIDAGLGHAVMQDQLSKEAIKQNLHSTPLRRFGEPVEVAAAVVFLLSAKAAFITGQTLAVDGGIQL